MKSILQDGEAEATGYIKDTGCRKGRMTLTPVT